MNKASARYSLVLIAVTLMVVCGSAAMCANLLLNPGFDAGAFTVGGSGGATTTVMDWTCVFPAGQSYCWQELDRAVPHYHGANAVHHSSGVEGTSGNGEAEMYQDVWVKPSSAYTASVNVWTVDAFGNAGTDTAGMHIIEYDISGSETLNHAKVEQKTATTDWVNLSESFSTQSTTVKIRFKIETKMACHWTLGRAVYDDCVLDGEAGSPPGSTVTGVVMAGTTPLVGASVTIGTTTVTAGAGGTYTIPNLVAESSVKITAENAGYFSENKYRTLVLGTNTVDFSLVQLPTDNLLANSSFDTWPNVRNGSYEAEPTQIESSWRLWFPAACMYATHEQEGVRAPGFEHSGYDAACHGSCGEFGECYMYQDIIAVPGRDYHAGAWIRGYGGFTPTDTASLWILEYNADGSVVTYDHGEQRISGPTQDFEYKQVTFTAQPGTATIRFMLHSSIAVVWASGRAIYDDCFLDGPRAQTTFTGTVRAGGSPVQGATVTIDTTTLTTGADGTYTFAPMDVVAGEKKITVEKTGYFSENKYRPLSNGTTTVDFDLELLPANQLLANPGFENWPNTAGGNSGTQVLNGWTCKWYGPAWSYFAHEQESVRAPGYQHSGYDAVCHAGEAGGGQLQMWQDIDVVVGQPYTASVWVKAHDQFGAAPGSPDSAGLWVQELDADGEVNVDHGKMEITDPTQDFVLQKVSFTAAAGTKKVRFMLDTIFSLTWPVERAIFDDCVLDGMAPPTYLTGTVMSGGQPIAGALVEILNRAPDATGGTVLHSAVTNASGVYRIDDETTGALVTVRASRSGYYAQGLGRTLAKGETVLNFDLVGANLLENAGFDDVWNCKWGTQVLTDPGYVLPETDPGVYGPVAFHSAEQAAAIIAGGGNGEALVYQLVSVQPSSGYSASVWFRAATNSTGTVWGDPYDTQTAGLKITEYKADGTVAVDHPLVAAAEALETWEQLPYTFTTSNETAFVSVGGYAYMIDNYYATLARAVFDDFELVGALGAAPLSVPELKALPEGSAAYFKDQVTSAQFPSYFYIESADRSAGIRVTGAGVQAGRLATAVGTVSMVDGEKTFTASQLITSPGGVRPRPLGINNRTALSQSGLSAVGLYVIGWGRVDSTGGNIFTISDGGDLAIKVYGNSGFSAVPNSYVRVRGALGSELSGEHAVPVLRALQVTQQD